VSDNFRFEQLPASSLFFPFFLTYNNKQRLFIKYVLTVSFLFWGLVACASQSLRAAGVQGKTREVENAILHTVYSTECVPEIHSVWGVPEKDTVIGKLCNKKIIR